MRRNFPILDCRNRFIRRCPLCSQIICRIFRIILPVYLLFFSRLQWLTCCLQTNRFQRNPYRFRSVPVSIRIQITVTNPGVFQFRSVFSDKGISDPLISNKYSILVDIGLSDPLAGYFFPIPADIRIIDPLIFQFFSVRSCIIVLHPLIFYYFSGYSYIIIILPAGSHHLSIGTEITVIHPLIFSHCPVAYRSQIVPASVDFLPAGLHPAVFVKMIFFLINGLPTIYRITSITVSIPPAVIGTNPLALNSIRYPCTGWVDITGSNPGIFCHLSIFIQIVPGTVDQLPAGQHCPTAVHVIPGSSIFYPTGMHRSASRL